MRKPCGCKVDRGRARAKHDCRCLTRVGCRERFRAHIKVLHRGHRNARVAQAQAACCHNSRTPPLTQRANLRNTCLTRVCQDSHPTTPNTGCSPLFTFESEHTPFVSILCRDWESEQVCRVHLLFTFVHFVWRVWCLVRSHPLHSVWHCWRLPPQFRTDSVRDYSGRSHADGGRVSMRRQHMGPLRLRRNLVGKNIPAMGVLLAVALGLVARWLCIYGPDATRLRWL